MRFLALVLLATACNTITSRPADTTATDTNSADDWWGGSDTNDKSSGGFTNDTDEYDEDDDFDTGAFEGEEFEELEKFWWVEARQADSQLSDAVQGFFFLDPAQTPMDRCDVTYEITNVSAVTDCSACTAAWEFTRGQAEVEADNGGCAELGALGLEGTTFKVGFSGETMYRHDGTDWVAGGEVFAEDGEIFMEQWIGEEPDDEEEEEEEE